MSNFENRQHKKISYKEQHHNPKLQFKKIGSGSSIISNKRMESNLEQKVEESGYPGWSDYNQDQQDDNKERKLQQQKDLASKFSKKDRKAKKNKPKKQRSFDEVMKKSKKTRLQNYKCLQSPGSPRFQKKHKKNPVATKRFQSARFANKDPKDKKGLCKKQKSIGKDSKIIKNEIDFVNEKAKNEPNLSLNQNSNYLDDLKMEFLSKECKDNENIHYLNKYNLESSEDLGECKSFIENLHKQIDNKAKDIYKLWNIKKPQPNNNISIQFQNVNETNPKYKIHRRTTTFEFEKTSNSIINNTFFDDIEEQEDFDDNIIKINKKIYSPKENQGQNRNILYIKGAEIEHQILNMSTFNLSTYDEIIKNTNMFEKVNNIQKMKERANSILKDIEKLDCQLQIDKTELQNIKQEVEIKLKIKMAKVDLAKLLCEKITRKEFEEIRSYIKPPMIVEQIAYCVVFMVKGKILTNWNDVKRTFNYQFLKTFTDTKDPLMLTQRLIKKGKKSSRAMYVEKNWLSKEYFTYNKSITACDVCGPIYTWISAQIEYAITKIEVKPIEDRIKELDQYLKQNQLKKQKINREFIKIQIKKQEQEQKLLQPFGYSASNGKYF